MATDCIIENWIKNMWQNHKVLVSSVLAILTLWVIAGVCLYVSGDDNFMSNLFSAGSAIGTIGAVITSLFLYNKSSKDNYDNMAKSQRSYMLVDSIEINSFTEYDKHEILVNFKNAGLSLATDIRFYANYGFQPYPLLNDFKFNDVEQYKAGSKFHCAAGDIIKTAKGYSNQDLNSIALQSSNSNKFYIWGWIEYNDIFTKNRHRTEFCNFCEITILASDPIVFSYKTSNYTSYNNTDENCLHSPKTS